MSIIIQRLLNVYGILKLNLFTSNSVHSLDVSSASVEHSQKVSVLGGSSIDASSRIGSYTYIGKNTHITKSSVGRYCSIANNVSIGQGEHKLDRVSTSACFYDNSWDSLTEGECVVESDVWIGVDAIILRGVKVGVGAVVAANAVVTKDVPPFAIVAGVPARVVRFRIPENKQQLILSSCWWEKDNLHALQQIRKLEAELELK